jgi:hypothetical protein
MKERDKDNECMMRATVAYHRERRLLQANPIRQLYTGNWTIAISATVSRSAQPRSANHVQRFVCSPRLPA